MPEQLHYTRLSWLLLALFLLLLAACGGTPATTPVVSSGPQTIAVSSRILPGGAQDVIPAQGEAAPDFEYTMPDGSTHTLSQLRGKKVLLNFWATWCGPCRSEMPDLQQTLSKYSDVVVIGVNKAQTLDQLGPFANELGVTFPLITNLDGDIAERYAAKLLPTTYFINSDGTIALRKTGVMNAEFIANHIEELK
ncbi:MAG: TlpA family protein disulfide reductase [Chloroflexi bacterium SZAS-1]|jgi:thiol-disulfide isomerase/thioredoxin|nr:TlpA family protein disulfide reductase [Chloroflexi bacterium SZAS-1]